jgi:NIMA (never in mitosis gene a)-related kinase
MEFADGGDLEGKIRERMKQNEGFEETFVWKVAFELFQGLHTLHRNKIVHRDIKSANVFFVGGIAKLGDLNVSKVLENGLCSTQTGTPYYTSPEIWKGRKYGRKCDIWSTGCLLYEMCTLHPPFRAKDFPGLYRKVVVGNYDPIPTRYSRELS